ncbi:MAG: beta-lactamase family protein [Limnochordales bacterium]|nr:beta-lactamase family protein [Limnochordales bacterium]
MAGTTRYPYAAVFVFALLFMLAISSVCPVAASSIQPAPTLNWDGQPEDVGMSTERLAWAKQVIEDSIKRNYIPGAVLLAARRGTVVLYEAFGVAQRTQDIRPMEKDTLFDLASVTKLFTATAVMILLEEGKLRLDDPVKDFIPAFAQKGKQDITIRQLLTHTSGLPAWAPLYREVKSKDEMYAKICAMELENPPGTEYVYSDLGYIMLGAIVEKVSGKPLDQFIKERITDPLGMEHTFYNPGPEWREKAAATEYDATFRRRLIIGEVHDENAWAMGGVSGHAGLFSTAADMARFAQMFLNYGSYGDVQILSPATVVLMTTNHTLEVGVRHGLGWDLKSVEYSSAGDLFSLNSYGHTGFTGTSIWIDPTLQLFSVLLTNRVHPSRSNTRITWVRPHLHNPVAAAIVRF